MIKKFKEFQSLNESSNKKKKDSYFDKDADDLFDDDMPSSETGSGVDQTEDLTAKNTGAEQADGRIQMASDALHSVSDTAGKAFDGVVNAKVGNRSVRDLISDNPVTKAFGQVKTIAAGNDPWAQDATFGIAAVKAISDYLTTDYERDDGTFVTGKSKMLKYGKEGLQGLFGKTLNALSPLNDTRHVINYTRGAGSSVLNMRNYTRGIDPVGVPNWQFFQNQNVFSNSLRPRK